MLVAGVDFSAAKTIPNDTWLAVGELSSLGLTVISLKNTGSHALAKELSTSTNYALSVLDFPFSVPIEFLRFLARKNGKEEFEEWQQLAEALVFMSFEDFKSFAEEYGIEPLRFTDGNALRKGKSPLHQVNPAMLQMTFHGIKFLAGLDPSKYCIQPFQDPDPAKCSLFEVYPREILHIMGLPDQGYKMKDKKNREKAQSTRKEIVDGLIHLKERGDHRYQSCPRLHVDNSLKGAIIASDHAVDALAAMYAAAIFFRNPDLYPDPLQSDNINVLLEGWIYGPANLLKLPQ